MRTNERQLADDALAAYAAAVEAAQPTAVLERAIARRAGVLIVAGEPLPRPRGRTLVVALGKAGPGLAAAWCELAPELADEVVVLAPHDVPVPPALAGRARVLRGAHPVPDEAGAAGCRELLDRAAALQPQDLLVVLLSGGASALLATPRTGLELADLQAVTAGLLAAGAPIGALNTVRRQLLAAAGGGLARAAAPAPVITLVLSDVLGNPLPDIASGPTVASPDGPDAALAVLERYRLHERLPRVVSLLASREAMAPPPAGRTVVIGELDTALAGAAGELGARGYHTVHLAARVAGEAAARGRQLAALARAMQPNPPSALVVGGEPTVTVRGRGRGGRAQELALAAAAVLDGAAGRLLLAAGTDGIDGPTANAGAVINGATTARLQAAGVDGSAALAANDAATALEAIGAVLIPGPTGTNVGDVVLLLSAPTH